MYKMFSKATRQNKTKHTPKNATNGKVLCFVLFCFDLSMFCKIRWHNEVQSITEVYTEVYSSFVNILYQS